MSVVPLASTRRTTLYTFAITLHARPADAVTGPSIEWAGRPIPTISATQPDLALGFARSFEEVADDLSQLPRMFIEPDGSFVWTSASAESPWQVDGVLYDRDGRLLFIDLKGSCPAAEFDRLLRTTGWPAQPVVCQLTRAAVLVDEATFRQIAESGAE